jgi:hypothetical protein
MLEIGNGGRLSTSSSSIALYPWAVAAKSAGAGWSLGTDGTVKHSGLCLTALSTIELTACAAGSATIQKFTLEKNGNLHLTARKESCLALQGGSGPGLTMAKCKSGATGKNEEFTLTNGQLCSNTLGSPSMQLCLKPETAKPSGGHGHGGGGGFDCSADAASLNRCRVHFTM